MSLWKVHDEAAQQLRVAFYKRVLKGEDRADAHRAAQLEMIARDGRSHPFYWASFILSGATGPITSPRAK